MSTCVGLSPDPGTIIPIFITHDDTGCRDQDSVQAMRCMVIKPTLWVYAYKCIAFIYVIVSITLPFQRLTNSGGQRVLVSTDLSDRDPHRQVYMWCGDIMEPEP